MDKDTRNAIERATQRTRKLLEEDFSSQLEGTFDVLRTGAITAKGGVHLSDRQVFQRDKIVAAVEHKRAAGMTGAEAVTDHVRDAAFTTLNRFVALKMLETRGLVHECISKGEQSSGYREFCGMAPGVALLPDAAGYRLYIESLFDELSTEVKLFDRRDAASVLWPKRQTFEGLLGLLNAVELAGVWNEDETIGWVYQHFNSGDERKKIREESQAPRNSHELAVRNQFFTPRYVVQFLTDNTLGRTWLQMRGGDTVLAERCEYLVRDGGSRGTSSARKDPRDLKVLDPACGSGHFLLYAFDLLLAIYEEAWHDQQASVRSQVSGRSLREDYPDLVALRRAVPALIVQHNLHGVDIDPRCTQIAALALWLRAQRAFKDFGVVAKDRTSVTRTHIVVAEPMPGDMAMVDAFAASLDPPLLRDLFKKMVGEMRLAGELGTLLRVEQGIAAELKRARDEFVAREKEFQNGYLPGFEPLRRQGDVDLSGIDDAQFFHEAEARIVEALRRFAESAAGGAGIRRRLFAGDAAQGIALIDLVQTRFDVVLMNPPFGEPTIASSDYVQVAYPTAARNLACAFSTRARELLRHLGYEGAIVDHATAIRASYEKFRRTELLDAHVTPISTWVHLGWGVLDANVETSARTRVAGYASDATLWAVDVAASASEERPTTLRTAVAGAGKSRVLQLESIARLPHAVIDLTWPDALVELFARHPTLEQEGLVALVGQQLKADRFYRLYWEVRAGSVFGEGEDYAFAAKGGPYGPYYLPNVLVARIGAAFSRVVPDSANVLRNLRAQFRAGVTYGKRGDIIDAQPLRACQFFTHEGFAFVSADARDLWFTLALLNSPFFSYAINKYCGQHKTNGYVNLFPCPSRPRRQDDTLVREARGAYLHRATWGQTNEIDFLFTGPAARSFAEPQGGLGARLTSVEARFREDTVLLQRHIANVETRLHEAYDFNEPASEYEGISANLARLEVREWFDDAGRLDLRGRLIADETSYLLGVALGAFKALQAGESFDVPDDPFVVYPSPRPCAFEGAPDIAVSEKGHRRYVYQLLAEAIRRVEPEPDAFFEELQRECERAFGCELERWIDRDFFPFHLARYSWGGRRAPVFWNIGTTAGSYTVWLYLHALTRDTLFKVQNEYVAPKLADEERRLASLRTELGSQANAAERKQLEAQESFVHDLRAFLDQVKRVAPLWNPNLDDGVIINFAPLWRLVPHHKTWQEELRATWDALCAGAFDWTHLAMHLWPERVVPKCAADRSLAIAHGLEDVFWTEGVEGRWKPRAIPTRRVEELIRERTSAAVQAALKNLLEAPMATAAGGRRRSRRSAAIPGADGGTR